MTVSYSHAPHDPVLDEAPGGLKRATPPVIEGITPGDLGAALQAGWKDFTAVPSHMIFVVLIYPIIALLAARIALDMNVIQLLFPLVAGFALVGPLAAFGLYEISLRRESGLQARWHHALAAFKLLRRRSIFLLSTILLALWLAWVSTAELIFNQTVAAAPESMGRFLDTIFSTTAGQQMLIIGNLTGFVFAAAVFVISVVSFPVLLDRDVSAGRAIVTSLQAVARNPVTMALWGLTIAVLLALGTAFFLVGLAVVLPLLGHASWHLYRRVVTWPDESRKIPRFE